MPSVTNTSTFSLEYLEAVRDVQYQWGASRSCWVLRGHTFTVRKSGRVRLSSLGFNLDIRRRDRICMGVGQCNSQPSDLALIVGRMRRYLFKSFYFFFRYILLAAQM